MPEETVNNNQITFFAETNFRNRPVKFGIKMDDRRRHMYLIGKTGMGKSTAMENMIIQDIANGKGVALVDPHGDFAEKILDFIPSYRVNDVVYLNPSDFEYPIAFNVMESTATEHKHLIASGLVGVFKKLWADSWGPRLEYVLRNAILALLDYPGSTLLGVMRILSDKSYRQKVIAKIQDPVVKAFWVEEYSKYPQQFQVEAIAPIQNKVGQFLSTALIRNVVGQVKSSFDLRDVMDNQKILIMNLSKGRIGEDSSALLGAMMITKIQLAAMSRIDMPEEKRKDFYLYVDEFQNFATESFANILSEARKYRLDLIIGHQYVEQLDEIVRAAVFGNVGTLMVFRIGAADAEFLATEFAPYFVEEDLVNLAKYDVYMKLMIDGVSSNPFSATTLPPLGKDYLTSNREKIIRVSRERYATPRLVVEDKISRWSGVMMEGDIEQQTTNNKTQNYREKKSNLQSEITKNLNNTAKPKSRDTMSVAIKSQPEKNNPKARQKQTYTVNCYECGNPTEISFKPDGVRPIYCQSCFQKIRDGVMRGHEKPYGVDQIETAPVSEISLNEALHSAPRPFDNKRVNTPEPPAPPITTDTDTKIPAKNENKQHIAEHLMPPPAPKKPPINDEEIISLQPGRVVKF